MPDQMLIGASLIRTTPFPYVACIITFFIIRTIDAKLIMIYVLPCKPFTAFTSPTWQNSEIKDIFSKTYLNESLHPFLRLCHCYILKWLLQGTTLGQGNLLPSPLHKICHIFFFSTLTLSFSDDLAMGLEVKPWARGMLLNLPVAQLSCLKRGQKGTFIIQFNTIRYI